MQGSVGGSHGSSLISPRASSERESLTDSSVTGVTLPSHGIYEKTGKNGRAVGLYVALLQSECKTNSNVAMFEARNTR